MVLDSKQTTVAYRCPHCGAGVMSVVGLFALSADMIKLKCTCGNSEMSVVYSRDGKVRLNVPCILCPNPHSYTVSSTVFFKNELFVLPCPISDINICMMGETNQVKAELARTELELLDMLAENGIEDLSALQSEEEETLTDPQIFDIIMFVINDLDAEGKISCKCPPKAPLPDGELPSEEGGRYEAQVLEGGILVTCRDCGASRVIPTDSLLGAHAFLNCDSLKLE